MLSNKRHNYVYVHVYKVAGQSVKLALARADDGRFSFSVEEA